MCLSACLVTRHVPKSTPPWGSVLGGAPARFVSRNTPETQVVKALNVLSAYVLENGGVQGNKEVDSYS